MGLKINRLQYAISTDTNKYGADIPFKDGLNVIYGPNSVGKTSIVTGLIYGLGAEKGLGVFKSIQNPFKPEFYKAIEGEKITRSYLLLEIENGERTVTIFRYITGGDNKIAAVKECSIDQFHSKKEINRLIVEGEGVFSEEGFQKFIFDFIGLETMEVPTYDSKNSKIYLENILPLFFVEQRAGWSQIQARQVTRYGIKDVKNVAFEFLMGLDRIKIHLVELEKRELENLLRSQRQDLDSKEENLMIISSGEKVDGALLINSPGIGRSSAHEHLAYLQKKYETEAASINSDEVNKKEESLSDQKYSITENLRRYDFTIRKLNMQLDAVRTEISGYQNYLERIQTNKYKNRQLKKIHELKLEFNINTCPFCEETLHKTEQNECPLCGNHLKRNISTPDQNLLFLEDEEKSFKKVLTKKILEKNKLNAQLDKAKEKRRELTSQLDHQTKTYAGKELQQLREKILVVDGLHNEIERIKRVIQRWDDLDPLRNDILKKERKIEKLKNVISEYTQSQKDKNILHSVNTNFRKNVQAIGLFKSNESLISNIKIDASSSYTPYLDNYDLYNISSSSDNIRIVLSYYISLLQSSLSLKEKYSSIGFPDLLILDEPKQQNLDNSSLSNCIDLFKDDENSFQVILTTYSELPSDKAKIEKDIIYEMKDSADYLLKRLD